MVSQGIMAFVEGGMRNGATGNDTLVVSKHIGLAIKRNSNHSNSITKVHNLFSGNVSSNELGTIGSSFNSLLTFGEPFGEIETVQICASPSTQLAGMGYFLLTSIEALKSVLTSPVIDKKVFYDSTSRTTRRNVSGTIPP
jgi:hypothetical protein